METKRIDYKALCEAPFEMESLYEDNFPMLVYTGRKEEERPVFRMVFAKGSCKARARLSSGSRARSFGGSLAWTRKPAKRSGTTTTTASAWRTGRC